MRLVCGVGANVPLVITYRVLGTVACSSAPDSPMVCPDHLPEIILTSPVRIR